MLQHLVVSGKSRLLLSGCLYCYNLTELANDVIISEVISQIGKVISRHLTLCQVTSSSDCQEIKR